MATITARIPDKLNQALYELALETDRNKGYIVRKALENYLEEKADVLIALSVLERNEETIPLSEIKKKYGLED